MDSGIMIFTKFSTYLDNTRFSASNKALEKKKKMISRKFLGLFGIHSVAVSGVDQKIKVYAHSITNIPNHVKSKIVKIGGKYHVIFKERKVKFPDDYHLEEIFDSNKEP